MKIKLGRSADGGVTCAGSGLRSMMNGKQAVGRVARRGASIVPTRNGRSRLQKPPVAPETLVARSMAGVARSDGGRRRCPAGGRAAGKKKRRARKRQPKRGTAGDARRKRWWRGGRHTAPGDGARNDRVARLHVVAAEEAKHGLAAGPTTAAAPRPARWSATPRCAKHRKSNKLRRRRLPSRKLH